MKTTVKKAFMDIHKEEEWLNEQGQNGLMLIAYHGGDYEFEDVSPAKYQYKIDLPAYTGNKKKEYLAFLEQTGISVVAEYGGRVYLRKNAADGPLDMYTEQKEAEKQMSKRLSFYFVTAISQFIQGINSDFLRKLSAGYSQFFTGGLYINAKSFKAMAVFNFFHKFITPYYFIVPNRLWE